MVIYNNNNNYSSIHITLYKYKFILSIVSYMIGDHPSIKASMWWEGDIYDAIVFLILSYTNRSFYKFLTTK